MIPLWLKIALAFISGVVVGCLLYSGRNTCVCAECRRDRWLFGEREQDEEWCGCDGMGMAHKPGAEGFACAEEKESWKS